MIDLSNILEEAWSHRRNGEYDLVQKLIENAKTQVHPNDYLTQGRIYHIYAQIETDHDRHEQSEIYLHQSVGAYRKSTNKHKIAHSVRHLADIQTELYKWKEAKTSYEESLKIYDEIDSGSMHHANALRSYAILLEKINVHDHAKTIWLKARDIYAHYDIQEGVDECNLHLNEN